MMDLRELLQKIMNSNPSNESDPSVFTLQRQVRDFKFDTTPETRLPSPNQGLTLAQSYDSLGRWVHGLLATEIGKQFVNNLTLIRSGLAPPLLPGQIAGAGGTVGNNTARYLNQLLVLENRLVDQATQAEQKSEGGGGGGGADTFVCPKPIPRDQLGVTFDDIKGLEQTKQALRIAFTYPILWPLVYRESGQNILLYGPPGTGKTLLAKAAIRELPESVAFIPVDSASLLSYKLGGTQSNIVSLFQCAKDIINNPNSGYNRVVLFFDEFDDLGRAREPGDTAAQAAVPTLLAQMQGIGSSSKINIIAATNLPDLLDDGIRRRFDKQIFVDLPDLEARRSIIKQALQSAYNWPHRYPGGKPTPVQIGAVTAQDRANRCWVQNIRVFGGTETKDQINASVRGTRIADKTRAAIAPINEANVSVAGGLQPSGDAKDQTGNFVDVVARLLGPNTSVQSEERIPKRGTGQAEEYAAFSLEPYGFTSSDIAKIVANAAGEAATRALVPLANIGKPGPQPLVQRVEIVDKALGDKKDVFWVLLPLDEKGQARPVTPFEAPCALGVDTGERKTLKLTGDVKTPDLARTDPPAADLVSFDIRPSDILLAVSKFKPSVNSESYRRRFEPPPERA